MTFRRGYFLRKFIAQTLFIIDCSQSKRVKSTFVPRQVSGAHWAGKPPSAALRHSDVGHQDITLNVAKVIVEEVANETRKRPRSDRSDRPLHARRGYAPHEATAEAKCGTRAEP